MLAFKRKLFGYRRPEVDNYFATLEREHLSVMAKKQAELNSLLENNERMNAEIATLAREVDALNQNKLQLVDSLNNELEAIDLRLQKNQAEAQERKLAALNKLRQKRDEVLNWYSILKQLRSDLENMQRTYDGRLS